MIIKDHTQDQVRINHLGVIMSLLDNINNCFSYSINVLVVDELDSEKGISKQHKEFKFDEKGLLHTSIFYEKEELDEYNKLIHEKIFDDESEDFEE